MADLAETAGGYQIDPAVRTVRVIDRSTVVAEFDLRPDHREVAGTVRIVAKIATHRLGSAVGQEVGTHVLEPGRGNLGRIVMTEGTRQVRSAVAERGKQPFRAAGNAYVRAGGVVAGGTGLGDARLAVTGGCRSSLVGGGLPVDDGECAANSAMAACAGCGCRGFPVGGLLVTGRACPVGGETAVEIDCLIDVSCRRVGVADLAAGDVLGQPRSVGRSEVCRVGVGGDNRAGGGMAGTASPGARIGPFRRCTAVTGAGAASEVAIVRAGGQSHVGGVVHVEGGVFDRAAAGCGCVVAGFAGIRLGADVRRMSSGGNGRRFMAAVAAK